jgi:hypothetical protein
MAGLKEKLKARELPWVIGLIAGMTGWTLTHAVDRITSAPLISYNLVDPLEVQTQTDGTRSYSGAFLVRNLTRDVAFTKARFQIVAGAASDPEGHLEPAEGSFIYAGEPFNANLEALREPHDGEKIISALSYVVPEMQPRQAWRLVFSGLALDKPALSLRLSEPPPNHDPTAPAREKTSAAKEGGTQVGEKAGAVAAVQLLQSNWQTCLVEHELGILMLLTLFFAILLIVSLLIL